MRKTILFCCFIVLLYAATAHAYCFEEAGREYNVSPSLLWAIAKTESGFNPVAVNHNTNGTYDYGLMQINSRWYRTLGRERWMKLGDGCFNVRTGAWVLSQCIKQHGYGWKAVGCYNAGKNLSRGASYARKIHKALIEGYGAKQSAYITKQVHHQALIDE